MFGFLIGISLTSFSISGTSQYIVYHFSSLKGKNAQPLCIYF